MPPAYNEGVTIIDNVLSLLLLKYPNYELVVVNDGSQDDSLEKLIQKFELIQVKLGPGELPLKTSKIRDIYKSKDENYNGLTVIDKENGGRSDAINAGINI